MGPDVSTSIGPASLDCSASDSSMVPANRSTSPLCSGISRTCGPSGDAGRHPPARRGRPARALVIARFTAREVFPSEDPELVIMMDFGGPFSEANARFVRTCRYASARADLGRVSAGIGTFGISKGTTPSAVRQDAVSTSTESFRRRSRVSTTNAAAIPSTRPSATPMIRLSRGLGEVGVVGMLAAWITSISWGTVTDCCSCERIPGSTTGTALATAWARRGSVSVTSMVMNGSVPSADALTDGYPEVLKGPAVASACFSAAWTAGTVAMISANAVARSAASWPGCTTSSALTAGDPLMMSRDVAWYLGVVNFVAAAAPPTQAIITTAIRIQRRRRMRM